MKKILFLAAACAALAACNVSDIEKESPAVDGNAFVKGQKVVLKVNAGSDTKAAGTLDGYDIGFTWSKGDEILVTVEGQGSATFTLKGEGGSASGEFEGVMPGSGTTFSAQYPATEPSLTTQTYDPGHAIASGLMKASATGCTVGTPFTLNPEYAVLRLNIYGGAREVSQIVVTGSSAATYTLSISSAVTVGKDKENATPFFVVLPATESFVSAAVTANAIAATTENTQTYTEGTFSGAGIPISASTTFTATEAKSLTPGSILNMKAVSLTTVWAPVNCGYDSDHTYGLIYQWGRTDGCTYDKAWTWPSSHAAETQTQYAVTPTWDENGYNKSPKSNEFYMDPSLPYDWYTNDSSKQLTEWPMTAPEGTSGIGNPCPEGWRVPTFNELFALFGGSSPGMGFETPGVTVGGQYGSYFNGTGSAASSGVFLPLAGSRGYSSVRRGTDVRGSWGYYWSSSVDGTGAWILYLNGGCSLMYCEWRAFGISVRCVQE